MSPLGIGGDLVSPKGLGNSAATKSPKDKARLGIPREIARVYFVDEKGRGMQLYNKRNCGNASAIAEASAPYSGPSSRSKGHSAMLSLEHRQNGRREIRRVAEIE